MAVPICRLGPFFISLSDAGDTGMPATECFLLPEMTSKKLLRVLQTVIKQPD